MFGRAKPAASIPAKTPAKSVPAKPVRTAEPAVQDIQLAQNPIIERDRTSDPIEVYDTDRESVIKILGSVYTNGPNAPTGKGQEYCALTNRKEFFVSRSHEHSPEVMMFRRRMEQSGMIASGTPPHLVAMSTIRDIYKASVDPGSATSFNKAGADSVMRRRFLDWIRRAANENASDLHISVEKEGAKIEMRIDGSLRMIAEEKYEESLTMLQAAYTLADVTDNQYVLSSFQGARIADSQAVELTSGVQALRLQWNPLVNSGRYLVCRLLYSNRKQQKNDLDSLGYSSGHLRLIKHMRQLTTGINIISGPTGSGKSTTLKVALSALARERAGTINILSVEDPPEYVIEHVKQMPVTNATTTDERTQAFQVAINAALRSDPNVLMIGEMRDNASAHLAFEGAMTGHQIWTTLHTNSAIGEIPRLLDMGVEKFKLYDEKIMTGMLGQRLIPKLCPHCKIPMTKAEAEGLIEETTFERALKFLSSLGATGVELFHKGGGCEHCRHGGYHGRSVVAEIIVPDRKFMELCEQKNSAAEDYWLNDMEMPYNVRGCTMVGHAATKMLLGDVGAADIEREVGLLLYQPWMKDAFGQGRPDQIRQDLL